MSKENVKTLRNRGIGLAFPYALSGLAATRPDVLSALSRIFWETLRLRYRRWARSAPRFQPPPNHRGAGGAATTATLAFPRPTTLRCPALPAARARF